MVGEPSSRFPCGYPRLPPLTEGGSGFSVVLSAVFGRQQDTRIHQVLRVEQCLDLGHQLVAKRIGKTFQFFGELAADAMLRAEGAAEASRDIVDRPLDLERKGFRIGGAAQNAWLNIRM